MNDPHVKSFFSTGNTHTKKDCDLGHIGKTITERVKKTRCATFCNNWRTLRWILRPSHISCVLLVLQLQQVLPYVLPYVLLYVG